MEHPGITIFRRHMATVIGEHGTYGAEADPHLSELKQFLGDRIPRPITVEQELRAAIDLYRLLDPDVARGRRVKRLHSGEVQVTFSQEQYDLLRSSAFAPMLGALEQGRVEPTSGRKMLCC